jgi:parvulin-like peptidyl-prolyl isomerase
MRKIFGVIRPFLVGAALMAIIGGCAFRSCTSLFVIPPDYKLKTTDILLGVETETPQAMDVRDFVGNTNGTLFVVQQPYFADSALCCYDAQHRKLPFVGTLVDVNAVTRSVLIARELQLMREKGPVAYVFLAPQDAKTVFVGESESYDLSRASSVLPSIRAGEMEIKKMVRERAEPPIDFGTAQTGRVHARHILVAVPAHASVAAKAEARQKLERIRTELLDGRDFTAVAREYSDCPSKENGGDLGTFSRGQMVKPFEDAAFSQKAGEIGPIIETEFGFHIIQVL